MKRQNSIFFSPSFEKWEKRLFLPKDFCFSADANVFSELRSGRDDLWSRTIVNIFTGTQASPCESQFRNRDVNCTVSGRLLALSLSLSHTSNFAFYLWYAFGAASSSCPRYSLLSGSSYLARANTLPLCPGYIIRHVERGIMQAPFLKRFQRSETAGGTPPWFDPGCPWWNAAPRIYIHIENIKRAADHGRSILVSACACHFADQRSPCTRSLYVVIKFDVHLIATRIICNNYRWSP